MVVPLRPGGDLVTGVDAGPALDDLRAAVGSVCDPELPPLTLVDLGILRSVTDEAGTVVVTVTPTYSGCPAIEYIEAEIGRVLSDNGCRRHRVERSLNPAWSSDWITDAGRHKLTEMGIAPPSPMPTGPVAVQLGAKPSPEPVPCPRCGSTDTELISAFGSTACKSLRRCRSCTEPFDHIKAI